MLAGKNVTGVSETGSGKTAVFALPILQRLSADPYGIFAVVLTPTRELAIQIDDQMQAFGAPIHVRTTLIIGGQSFVKQAEALRQRPHVVIATPGRFLQHLKTADPPVTKRLGFIVLDECDRMLSDSLKSEVEEIISLLKSRCVTTPQFLFLTATYDDSIRSELVESQALDDIQKSMDIVPDYEYIPSTTQQAISTVDGLDEFYLLTPDHVKLAYFLYFMVHSSSVLSRLPFSESAGRRGGERLRRAAAPAAEVLRDRVLQHLPHGAASLRAASRVFRSGAAGLQSQIDNVALHSLLSQPQRAAALSRFRNSRAAVLVCTDVASRGLDIPQVDLVANYDLPLDPFDYIHRVGRTARAGRTGTAVSFLTLSSVRKLQAIESLTGKRCRAFPGIQEEDVLKILGRVGRSLRVARQLMVENGLEERLEERREKKKHRREQGKNGETGETQGDEGSEGTNGAKGMKGANGAKGIKGTNGTGKTRKTGETGETKGEQTEKKEKTGKKEGTKGAKKPVKKSEEGAKQ